MHTEKPQSLSDDGFLFHLGNVRVTNLLLLKSVCHISPVFISHAKIACTYAISCRRFAFFPHTKAMGRQRHKKAAKCRGGFIANCRGDFIAKYRGDFIAKCRGYSKKWYICIHKKT